MDFVANRILENLGDMIGGEAKSKLIEQYAKISCKKRYTWSLLFPLYLIYKFL